MIVSGSNKFRVVGSASLLALTVGLAAGLTSPAFAQSAPDPLVAPPAPPGAPTIPGNAEECTLSAGVVTCAPGTDADGFFDVSGDPLELDVQDGSVVQNSIIITGSVTGTVDGVVATDGQFEDGLLLGADSSVTINGVVQTTGQSAEAIETEARANVINNGTLSAVGANADGVALDLESSLTNNGTVITGGDGVFGFGDEVTVNNTVTGSIISTGPNGSGVTAQNSATVDNAGLIQSFGQNSPGVELGASGTLTNSGNIATSGNGSTGVVMGDDGSLTNSGNITATGQIASGAVLGANAQVSNSGTISSEGNNFADALVVGDGSTVTNSGTISSAGNNSFGAFGSGSNVSITNTDTGTISTSGDGSFGIVTADGGTVVNDGTVQTTGDFAIGVDMLSNGDVTNSGSIETTGESAFGVGLGANSSLNSSGSITTAGDNAAAISAADGASVALAEGSTLTTAGANSDGIAAGGASVITNAGTITTDLGRGIDAVGAATITNEETGTISSNGDNAVRLRAGDSTLTNNGTIAAQVAVAGLDGTQTVENFGSLTGQSGDAVLLGNDADEFQQWTGASVEGNIDLQNGDDTFILEGTASSVNGTISGGAGTDAAIIAGTLDADNLVGFESFQIGSDLGGTLNDAVISGNRTLDGDVTVAGDVTLGLGVDSLTTTGAITLEEGATITIDTPLGAQLAGQTVTVLQEGTTFTDNGATIEIIDDDLFIDYQPVIGSLAVQVISVNPLTTSDDANIVAFGAAIDAALAGGTLSQNTLDILNDAGDFAALEAATADALPSLSGGAGREIFEASNTASEALDRHLASDESGVWGEFAFRGAEQDATSVSSGGYESEQMIITLGGDVALGEMAKVGLIASYADIENDDLTNGVERGTTDIESIKLGVYGGLEFAERGFVNVELSYLTGEVEQARIGALGSIDSAFDFDGFGYRAVIGYDVLDNPDFSLTPKIGLNGANISFDDAIESGGFDFTVVRDDADFLELRGGLELSGTLGSRINGFVSGTYAYELEDDPRVFQLASAELGNLTVGVPGREQSRFELAAGATINLTSSTTFELGYLGDFASDYDAHAARASVRVGF